MRRRSPTGPPRRSHRAAGRSWAGRARPVIDSARALISACRRHHGCRRRSPGRPVSAERRPRGRPEEALGVRRTPGESWPDPDIADRHKSEELWREQLANKGAQLARPVMEKLTQKVGEVERAVTNFLSNIFFISPRVKAKQSNSEQ